MHRPRPTTGIEIKAEEEITDLDRQAVEAGLAEIECGEILTLAELRRELAERRPSAN